MGESGGVLFFYSLPGPSTSCNVQSILDGNNNNGDDSRNNSSHNSNT